MTSTIRSPTSRWRASAPRSSGARGPQWRSSSAAYAVKRHGLFADREYLGLVLMKVGGRTGDSRLTMPLWLQDSTFRLLGAYGT